MVFEWGDKEEICYRLYVEERKTLDEVMGYMRENHNFKPSKRAFQTQFKRWQFPSKQHPAHKDDALVERIRQLWDANTTQKEMLRILNEEGFDIKERELMRVRAKHRWLLRVPNGAKVTSARPVRRSITEDVAQTTEDEALAKLKNARNSTGTPNEETVRLETGDIAAQPAMEAELPPEIKRKRDQRLAKLQEESDQKWAVKKRRRRTRGWAGLAADPPGPPRFPSETTIDESKAFLRLTNESYREVRDQFQAICEEDGIIKKTTSGPEKWQAAKERLISENQVLNNQFFGPMDGVPIDSKSIALDVLCTDVTKRMRTLGARMTISEAKNVLHINPEQSRALRERFHEILLEDRFTSKLDAGDEHWNQLKQLWVESSLSLTQSLDSSENAEQRSVKERAIETICRDVMKRLRDDQTKRDPSRQKQVNTGPGPGPAPPKVIPAGSSPKPSSATASSIPVRGRSSHSRPLESQSQLQIDPSLLAAASHPSLLDQLQQYATEAEGQNLAIATHFEPTSHQAVAAYFRLNPSSPVQSGPKIWLGTLSSGQLTELGQVAEREHPKARVAKVEGVITDQHGNETLFPIERDDELGAYLQYVAGRKPTFSVQLVGQPENP